MSKVFEKHLNIWIYIVTRVWTSWLCGHFLAAFRWRSCGSGSPVFTSSASCWRERNYKRLLNLVGVVFCFFCVFLSPSHCCLLLNNPGFGGVSWVLSRRAWKEARSLRPHPGRSGLQGVLLVLILFPLCSLQRVPLSALSRWGFCLKSHSDVLNSNLVPARHRVGVENDPFFIVLGVLFFFSLSLSLLILNCLLMRSLLRESHS